MRLADIRATKFKSRLSGYDKEEVERFVKEVAQTVDHLETSNQYMQQELYDKNAKLDEFVGKESALNRSIVVAQEAADQLKADALDEAAQIIERAEEEAKQILADAGERAVAVRTEMAQLSEVGENFHQQLLQSVDGLKAGLEEERWARLFSRAPKASVQTPELERVIDELDLPVRNDRAEEIFDLKNKKAEEKRKKEEFFAQAEAKMQASSQNNDVPALDPADLKPAEGEEAEAPKQDEE